MFAGRSRTSREGRGVVFAATAAAAAGVVFFAF